MPPIKRLGDSNVDSLWEEEIPPKGLKITLCRQKNGIVQSGAALCVAVENATVFSLISEYIGRYDWKAAGHAPLAIAGHFPGKKGIERALNEQRIKFTTPEFNLMAEVDGKGFHQVTVIVLPESVDKLGQCVKNCTAISLGRNLPRL